MMWTLEDHPNLRRACALRNLDLQVRRANRSAGNVTDLLHALDEVALSGAELNFDTRAAALRALRELALVQGAFGERFNEARYLGTVDALRAHPDLSTWQNHIIDAEYHSRVDTGGTARRRGLETALRCCRTNRDLVAIAITLAQYRIDIGDYRVANAILAKCGRLATLDASCADELPHIHACIGNSFYAQGCLTVALRHFRTTLTLSRRTDLRPASRPLIKAHLYIGRIYFWRGRYRLALHHLLEAQELLERGTVDARRSGYHHLRLGELLAAAGNYRSAELHLARSQELFRNGHERATGQAHHDSATATLELHRVPAQNPDAPTRASTLLNNAARLAQMHNYRRGLVLIETKRALNAIRHRHVRDAILSVQAALRAWGELARAGGPVQATAGAAEFIAVYLVRTLRNITQAIRPRNPLPCPCSDCRTVRPDNQV